MQDIPRYNARPQSQKKVEKNQKQVLVVEERKKVPRKLIGSVPYARKTMHIIRRINDQHCSHAM